MLETGQIISASSTRVSLSGDQFDGPISVRIDADQLAALTTVSRIRGLAEVAWQWSLVVLPAAGMEYLRPQEGISALWMLGYLFLVVWVAGRQHALGILLHDAVHLRLSPVRAVNDFVGEWLLSWPLQISLRGYRLQHFHHHRNVGNPDDPDFNRAHAMGTYAFPKTRSQLVRVMLRYVAGGYSLAEFRGAYSQLVANLSLHFQALRIFFYVLLVALAVRYGFMHFVLLYWLVPLSTFLMLLLYLRLLGEHDLASTSHDVFDNSRHIVPAWWERGLVAPCNVNHHLDHHLFPAVPFYRLPELHALLLQDAVYRRRAQIVDGYCSGLLGGVYGMWRTWHQTNR